MGAISRRRALGALGAVGAGALAAACSSGSDDGGASGSSTTTEGSVVTTSTTAGGATTSAAGGGSATVSSDVAALLEEASTCTVTPEEMEGPYWFDVDSVRRDIREDREGTPLRVGLRVVDAACAPIADAVVEVWHCDALGSYSGFEAASEAANGPRNVRGQMGPGGGGGGARTDEETYLRGAQVTDANGVVEFLTVYPGWYTGRAVHIHLKVHLGNTTALTTQLYFPDDLTDEAHEAEPYVRHTGDRTRNGDDMIYDAENVAAVARTDDGWAAALTIGLSG